MPNLRSMFAVSAIAAMAGGFATLPVESNAADLAGRSVKIGAMVPLSGKGAEWGQTAKLGMEIAQEEINAAGGIGGVKLKIVFYDTQTKEAEGLKIIRKLATRDKVLAVSGPCFSSLFEIIAPQLDRLKLPIISYCSSKPGLSAMSKWAFRNTLTSDKQLKPVVKAWVNDYGIKSTVIIHDIEDAVSKAEGTKILPGLMKNNGVKVLDMLTYRTKDTDFSAQITKAKSLNPDGIALGSCYQQAAGIAKEARKQGLNVTFVGGACAGAPGFVQLGGSATEGSYMSTAAWIDDPRAKVQNFLKKVVARNKGKKPPYSAPRGYDNIYVLKMIIEEGGVTNKSGDLSADRNWIRQGWANLKGYDGVSGETTMNDVGDGSGASAILKVIGGKYVNVKK
jgi:branched-chain amino acid transport system substrate-binding protein